MPLQTQKKERAVIASVEVRSDEFSSQDTLDELEGLVNAAGGIVVERVVQNREKPDPKTYIGQGKVQEIAALAAQGLCDLVVFDEELTPSQQRNLEEGLSVKVIDRTRLILDIFASRASTREANLEVELAQLEYLLPRLSGKGKELSQLGGGIGTRGPGETKLEMDRRRIRDKISMLKRRISEVSDHRALLRGRRRSKGYELISLVGYTNAGKSTLLNTLAHEHVYVADKLFATLDPVTRKVFLPKLEREVLFSDTVGFIRKLPHTLVNSFKATLEEVIHADVLVHVVDASSPTVEEQVNAVFRVLEELTVMSKPMITVLNKLDLIEDKGFVERLKRVYYPAVAVSAREGTGIPELLALAGEVLHERGSA